MKIKKEDLIWGLLRLSLGWIFFWAFLDKLFGLGFSTKLGKGWLEGVSPTYGFLKFGAKGIFSAPIQSLAGNPLVDWLFMLGLFFIGISLILGIFVKLSSYAGIIILFLMWLSLFPSTNNPFLDKHLVYLILMCGFIVFNAGNYIGLGKWWSRNSLVSKYPILK